MRKKQSKIRMEVLEIIGLSEIPLSSYAVHQTWINKYSPDRNLVKSARHERFQHTYIYDIIKDYCKPDDVDNPENYLRVSYQLPVMNELKQLVDKYNSLPEEYQSEDYFNQVHVIETENQRRKLALEIKIDGIHREQKFIKNHRNWRFALTIRGFIQYLLLVYIHDKISKRKINAMVDNLSKLQDYKFLECLKVYSILDPSNERKTHLTLNIALELQNQFKILTSKSIKYYMMRRCYDEIASFYAEENRRYINYNFLKTSIFKGFMDFKFDNLARNNLKMSKIMILKELIPMQEQLLNDMITDLKTSNQEM